MRQLAARLLTAGLSLTLAAGAAAQARPDNPHGPLPSGLDCSSCHSSNGWKPVLSPMAFDHTKATGFSLTGKHATMACAGCHLDLRFNQPRVAETQCASCHVDVHQGRMSGACTRCHNTTSFHDVAAIALHARVGFPLAGAHLQAPCESCHKNDTGGAFAPLPHDCVSCHRQDFAAATSPDHAAAGFPTSCENCHATVTWTGGVAFDHAAAANGFALVGAHALLRCEDCHMPPNFALKFTPSGQNDCIACHQAQFDRAHGGGFPTTCIDCHSQNSWSGAHFDHNQFPLSGPHDASCNTCHTTQGDFTAFTCFQCHAHEQTLMDEVHARISGYTYDSAACYRCHAGGRGGG
jgi:hypothetical protein